MAERQVFKAHGLHILVHWTEWTVSRSSHKRPAPHASKKFQTHRPCLPAAAIRALQLTSVPSRQAPDSVGRWQAAVGACHSRSPISLNQSHCGLKKAACTRAGWRVRRMMKDSRPTAPRTYGCGVAVPHSTAPRLARVLCHRWCIVLVAPSRHAVTCPCRTGTTTSPAGPHQISWSTSQQLSRLLLSATQEASM
jgi:hypothetical protein